MLLHSERCFATQIVAIMARRSLRKSEAVAPRSTSKRPLSSQGAPTEAKRVKGAKSTPTKSDYFPKELEDDEEENLPSSEDDQESVYRDEEGSIPSLSNSEEDGDEDAYSGEEGPTRKKKASKQGNGTKNGSSPLPKELWKPGVKTGLGPGTQVIIKKPKAREAGSTLYEDRTIHPNTFLFLRDLAANNNREWMKSEYTQQRFTQSPSLPGPASCHHCVGPFRKLDAQNTDLYCSICT